MDSLNLCTPSNLVHVMVIAALYEMPPCDVVSHKLALLRGHLSHNQINELSISNIYQVNHPYNFLVHEPGFPLLQPNSSLFFLTYININNIIIYKISQYILASDLEQNAQHISQTYDILLRPGQVPRATK